MQASRWRSPAAGSARLRLGDRRTRVGCVDLTTKLLESSSDSYHSTSTASVCAGSGSSPTISITPSSRTASMSDVSSIAWTRSSAKRTFAVSVVLSTTDACRPASIVSPFSGGDVHDGQLHLAILVLHGGHLARGPVRRVRSPQRRRRRSPRRRRRRSHRNTAPPTTTRGGCQCAHVETSSGDAGHELAHRSVHGEPCHAATCTARRPSSRPMCSGRRGRLCRSNRFGLISGCGRCGSPRRAATPRPRAGAGTSRSTARPPSRRRRSRSAIGRGTAQRS